MVDQISEKKLVVGVDEAGYGPNLGPLLIGGSAWLIPNNLGESEFCELISASFQTLPWTRNCLHVPLGDSKKLYQPSSGLRSLEFGLLAMLAASGQVTSNLDDLLASIGGCDLSTIENPPWYQTLSALSVPADPRDLSEIDRLRQIALDHLRQHQIELLGCRAMVITEPEFNRQVSQCDSKGRVLSSATLNLVSQLLQFQPSERVEIFCDRQGGRKNYLPLLLEWMPESWFVETQQTPQRCSYRASAAPQLDIHFTIGGDSFPPTALASMVAKYLRERLMEAFNVYWLQQCPGLKPTAGYPLDARRFRKSIEAVAKQNSLPIDVWWRHR